MQSPVRAFSSGLFILVTLVSIGLHADISVAYKASVVTGRLPICDEQRVQGLLNQATLTLHGIDNYQRIASELDSLLSDGHFLDSERPCRLTIREYREINAARNALDCNGGECSARY